MCLALASLLLPALPAAAQVITYTSATASWRDATDNVPGVQPGDPVITNGVPTSSISWGGATPQSGYDVTITIPDPTQPPVADFTHRNFPVPDPSLTSVVLDMVIDFEVDGIPFGPLIFTYTFIHEETPNNLDPCPYPTPPGEGCTDRVIFFDAPQPTTFTVGGKTYTLGMTFLDSSGNPVDEFITSEGGVANTAELDVQFALVPPVLEVTKSGPATLAPGEAGAFTIDAQNTGPNDAFDITIRDLLPDGATGGMCDATPEVLSAQVFEADGVTPVPGKGPLLQGTDFVLSYAAAPTCELTLTMSSAAAVVAEDERLIITYQTQLDGGTQFGATLTNVAGAIEWFDDDTSNPIRGTYTETLSDGTVGTVDHEDAHTLTTDPLDYLFEKTVVDPISGALLTTAGPGDTLRYRLRLENRTASPLVGLGVTDEIDRLNGSPLFVPGSLTLVTVPATADTSGTDLIGGAAGTGLVDVRDISVPAGGSELVEFDVTLVALIADGTLVTDQAELLIADVPFGLSDDPGVNGPADPLVPNDEDPTVLQIASVQDFRVEKVSAYLDGDPAVLLAGERLRYTITVVNVGNDDADDATLRDAIPVNTTYIPDSTTLNGVPVADPAAGLAPFVNGMPIQAAGAASPGSMPADPTAAAASVATLEFDVLVDPNVVDGTIISNQAFVSAAAGGVVDQPSDDPGTPLADDPTRDVVGNAPLLFAAKSVVISVNNAGLPSVVDPGDELRYTITIVNSGAVPATGVVLSDAVPAGTSYVPDSVTLNGLPVGQPDGGVSPLIAGIPVSSADLTPPTPIAGAGTISPGATATVTFDLRVDVTTPVGTVISNQAVVGSVELPNLPTDGDGNPATGPEPTVVVVGGGQLLTIAKSVTVVGGGAAVAGGQLEYLVQVTNVATVPATNVVITDDLDLPVAGQLTYVPSSATLNGAPAGVSMAGSVLMADYGAAYGALPPGGTAVLRFLANIESTLPLGTTITNTGVVSWDTPPQSASASVSIDVGGMPGVGVLAGTLWHDANFDTAVGVAEQLLAGWAVQLFRNGTLVLTATTDAAGVYQINGLAPNDVSGEQYALRFRAPGAGPSTASLGFASSPYTNGPQEITDIVVTSGSNLQGLDLPIQPNGVVYDSLQRVPIAGATLTLVDATSGLAIAPDCFADTAQQGQVTLANGYYKFDLEFGDASCQPGVGYEIVASLPAGGAYQDGLSQTIPPQTSSGGPPYDVPACPGDAVPGTAGYCEVQASSQAPLATVPAGDPLTDYYAHLLLDDSASPGSAQLFNNHLPVDPAVFGNIDISKTTPKREVAPGDLVPYEIALDNALSAAVPDLTVVDRYPAGFKYVEGSARVDDVPREPAHDAAGRTLTWTDVGIEADGRRSITLLLAVGAGVGDGKFTNRAQAISSTTLAAYSGEATATVRVAPAPDFACTDVIGKVFDDRDRDGTQDEGEPGLAGVRLVTLQGLVANTDPHGRFHITCAAMPNGDRGSNFALKLDERSLPTGYRMSTRSVQVKRATQGKALRFRFGASIHRVVGLDLADAVFHPDSTEIREQWLPRFDRLMEELATGPATLRLAYLGDTETAAIVKRRIGAVKDELARRWQALERDDELLIETEIYWRRGAPADGNPVAAFGAGALESLLAPFRKGSTRESGTHDAEETHLPAEGFTQWSQDAEALARERGDRLEQREVVTQEAETIKLKGVVPAIRFDSGVARIPPETVDLLRGVLDEMRDLENVRLHLVGHADDQPLSPSLAALYGDNEGLSRERAGEVAEYLQTRLALPPEAVSFAFAGASEPVATNATAEGRALNRRVEVEVWHDRRREALAMEEVVVTEELKRIQVCRTETVCKLRYREGHEHRARIRNLIAPLHIGEDLARVPDDFVEQVRQALLNLRDKQNVTVKFIGFTDDAPLEGRAARIYGTHEAVSKARAHRVARAVQERLGLASAAVASDGHGAEQPVASNASERGRAINQRIEVEFWYDDPLQELPDEPQPCPDPADAELVTRVYDPPWGRIEAVSITDGDPEIPHGLHDALRRALDDVARQVPDAENPRVRFTGYTRNERLDRRVAAVYGDDVGLSTARARRTMERVTEAMGLGEDQAEFRGRGYVHASDPVNGGFLQGQDDFVSVEVVYDERRVVDGRDGIDVTPITRELRPKDPLALNSMHITIDGEPLDDPGRSSADVQRCTDVALDAADLRFEFDDLQTKPRLSLTSAPATLAVPVDGSPGADSALLIVTPQGPKPGDAGEVASLTEAAGALPEPEASAAAAGAIRFRMYTNYGHFIERSEVRIFEPGQSTKDAPLAVIPIDRDGTARWEPGRELTRSVRAPKRELRFILRAYDAEGRFDETAPQTLWLVPGGSAPGDPGAAAGLAASEGLSGMAAAVPTAPDPLLAGYGDTGALLRNIPLHGSGTVRVHGSGVPEGHSVWLAGTPVPLDRNGRFVAEALLPPGMHTVEVAVLDPAGNGELFLRDLEIERDDWFYTAIADMTFSYNATSGPESLLQGQDSSFDPDSNVDGRFAFFLKGRFDAFGEDWGLVAQADTGEGPIEDIFKDFVDKEPEALFRRLDTDYYYPTFGDDGTVDQEAPTSGKFFVKLTNRDNHLMWGNFKVQYLGNELSQVDRGLYGANAHYQGLGTTDFGEQRVVLDGFAATPGTVPSREEFRGTGGSLYYLRVQDLLEGSDRLRIEIRDKDSGLVNGVVHLRPGVDYDIDYLQGRVLLSEPLSATAADGLLVRRQGLDGDELWLVVQYEYTPGFDDVDALTFGGEGHYWLTDFLRLGATANHNDNDADDSSLYGADFTLRRSADSWLKVQYGRSDGLVSRTLSSDDGGFEFLGTPTTALVDAKANGYRADLALGFADVLPEGWGRGHVSAYAQLLDAGYSSPGTTALSETKQYGGVADLPITDELGLRAKADYLNEDEGLETTTAEADLAYELGQHWTLSAGVRYDQREDDSPVVPATQEEGARTDAVGQIGYDSRGHWKAYAFGQGTVQRTGNRESNERYGLGGAYRLSDRLVVDGEVSHGASGPALKVGTSFQESEQTRRYLSYAYENERGIDGLHERRGSLISGARTRYSDSGSVFVEERYQHADSEYGLSRAMGLTMALSDRWSVGANWEFGTLIDRRTYAETDRNAGGAALGYRWGDTQLSVGVEYRNDDAEMPDGSRNERTTWLFKNSLKLQLDPDWRLLLKANHSMSDSSMGAFFGGGYTEVVTGFGFRPVRHDRLDVLAKYTYFSNMPTADQRTSSSASSRFLQRSHIASLDLSYDLTSSWSIGGKYAYRRGEVSLDRVDPEFFSNDAHLAILRTDYRFWKDWEVLVEGRMLALPDLDERKGGALLTLYRYLGGHLKVGIGYNFTDFSDDLTDLDYDHHGVFLNIVGSL